MENYQLFEMEEEDFRTLTMVLKSLISRELKMDFVLRDHFINRMNKKGANTPRDRAPRDYEYVGANVTPQDIFNTVRKFITKYKGKIVGLAQSGKEVEGVIDDDSNKLRIVFAIDAGMEYRVRGKRKGRNKFKIITMHQQNHTYRAQPGTKRFVV